ncbi:MAG: hypothetical protein Q8K70_09480 [Bacteroidota bacterium]|nr:hypothetical protein [Bacteroidota bacterium]
MKVKNILIIIVLVCLHASLNAQIEEKDSFKNRTFKERLTFNVGGGILFGTVTNVNILPQIGYRLTPRLTTGIGGNFQYFSDSRTPPIDFMIYGGNAFTRFTVDPRLFLQAEYQKLYYNNTNGDYVMVGGGFMPGAGFFISAYYLLLYPPDNIYGQPFVIRGGFIF